MMRARPGLLAILFIALAGWLLIALSHDLFAALTLGSPGVLAWMYP